MTKAKSIIAQEKPETKKTYTLDDGTIIKAVECELVVVEAEEPTADFEKLIEREKKFAEKVSENGWSKITINSHDLKNFLDEVYEIHGGLGRYSRYVEEDDILFLAYDKLGNHIGTVNEDGDGWYYGVENK